jgi:hypothetical protein
MVVELKRDADDLIAFLGQEPRHDGRIDTARHGNDDTRRFGPSR